MSFIANFIYVTWSVCLANHDADLTAFSFSLAFRANQIGILHEQVPFRGNH